MRVRDRVGLNFPPLVLRVMLGVIVLWMGLGKILGRYDVQGQDAAILGNLGIITPVTAAAPPVATPPPSTQPDRGKNGAQSPQPEFNIRLASQTAIPAKYTAADFQTPVKVRKLYTIALAIRAAAEPPPTSDGTPRTPTWPKALADGQWPIYLAWTAAIVETVGGVGLILGLLTRFWALLFAGRMLVALWLTQIGPAVQSGDALLGFLPNHDAFDSEKWRPLILHFVLMMSAFALLFLGPGRASLDHAIFAPARTDDDDDDDDV